MGEALRMWLIKRGLKEGKGAVQAGIGKEAPKK